MSYSWRIGINLAITVGGLLFLFQNCQNQGLRFNEYTDETGALFRLDESIGNKCALPWDRSQFIDNDESVQAFESTIVNEGTACHAQTRVCGDGHLSGSFDKPICTILPANNNDCVSPWSGGSPIANNASITAYKVDAMGQCTPEVRTCTNGTLSNSARLPACPGVNACRTSWGLQLTEGQSLRFLDDKGTPAPVGACGVNVYIYSCSGQTLAKVVENVACAGGDCTAPWGTRVKNGAAIQAYKMGVVTNDAAKCAGANTQMRTCTNGRLSGSFTQPACGVGCAAPWDANELVPIGKFINAYEARVVGVTRQCRVESRVCVKDGNNAKLTGTFMFKTCRNSDGSCTFDGQTIAHGPQFTAYKSRTVPAGEECRAGARQCFDGGVLGDPDYKYLTCTVAKASCTLNGATVAHGQSREFYRVRYNFRCDDQKISRTCDDGKLSGSDDYRFASCDRESGRGDR